jgi:hypothetical protein
MTQTKLFLSTFGLLWTDLMIEMVGNEPATNQHRVWETFELNQLKSAPSQLLPVFPGFDRLETRVREVFEALVANCR